MLIFFSVWVFKIQILAFESTLQISDVCEVQQTL